MEDQICTCTQTLSRTTGERYSYVKNTSSVYWSFCSDKSQRVKFTRSTDIFNSIV